MAAVPNPVMKKLLNGKRPAAAEAATVAMKRPAAMKRPSQKVEKEFPDIPGEGDQIDIDSDEQSHACSEEVRDAVEFMEYLRSLPILPLSCTNQTSAMK